jgi:hypothetical protein
LETDGPSDENGTGREAEGPGLEPGRGFPRRFSRPLPCRLGLALRALKRNDWQRQTVPWAASIEKALGFPLLIMIVIVDEMAKRASTTTAITITMKSTRNRKTDLEFRRGI